MAPTAPKKAYEHEEFPRMLYRAHPTSGEVVNLIVKTQEEMDAKLKEGWVDHPDSVESLETDEPMSAVEAQSLRMQIEKLRAENEALRVGTGKTKKAKVSDDE